MSERVVAELGRPETPAETAARKAESSRIYRSSQTTRNLIAALIVTLAIVVVMVIMVPRGTPAQAPAINVAERAATAESSLGRTVLAPPTPTGWRVNLVELQAAPQSWRVVYAPNEESDDSGFLTMSQVFDGTNAWTAQNIVGASETGTVTVDGIEWTEYSVRKSDQSRNITYALGTQIGPDWVVLYGSATKDVTKQFASSLSDEILSLQEGSK